MYDLFASALEYVLDFSNILNLSISASWLVLAVLFFRIFLKKAPKWVNVCLWGLVGVRLVLPVSIESSFSLIPSAQTIPSNIMRYEGVRLQQQAYLNIVTNPVFQSEISAPIPQTMDQVQVRITLFSFIWLMGIGILLIYTLASYWHLRRNVATAVRLWDNVYQSEFVDSPFVLGIWRTRIYLPYHLSEEQIRHVISHERAHIRRRDHWWKPLGFLLLTIHWFNPVMWVAYILLCRDIELACDEKVIKNLGNRERADYTQALVSCSIHRRRIAACPLAFGEVGVKKRVRAVMNYKKPTFWIVLLAIAICVIFAFCFLTNPISKEDPLNYFIESYLRDSQPVEVKKIYNRKNEAISVTVLFEYTEGPTSIELVYGTLKNGSGNEWTYTDPMPLGLGDSITLIVPGDTHFSFTAAPLTGSQGNIRLVFTEQDNMLDSYEYEGVAYCYKLELTGSFPNSDVKTTFVVLTNREDLTFDMVAKSLYSSNLADQLSADEVAVIEINQEETYDPTVPPETVYTSQLEAAGDLAYFLEIGSIGKEFEDMDSGELDTILGEYGTLLDDYSLVARASTDGSTFYIAGYWDGESEENPLHNMSGFTSGDADGLIQVLYPFSEEESVEQALAGNQAPEHGFCIRNSYINFSESSGYILIRPMEDVADYDKVFRKYITAGGRDYMLDALERGIALCTPEGPYLEVYLISEKWGEISEIIPLTEEQVTKILAEPRQKLENGYGFMARLNLGSDSSLNTTAEAQWFNENKGVPQTVLDLAIQKCGYQFASPRDITGSIVEAALECPWLETTLHAKEEDLQTLQRILTNAEFGYMGACGYGARLTITLSDGKQLVMFKGTDGCDSLAFGSYGGYFIGDQENLDFWEIFGLSLEDGLQLG